MGTRSVTHFKESSTADPFMTLYRQYDGNPQNHGLDMVRFMQGKELVNGFGIDVTHNFNIPEYTVLLDAVPGRINTVWFSPNVAGEFDIQCREYCGLIHYNMRALLIVEDV